MGTRCPQDPRSTMSVTRPRRLSTSVLAVLAMVCASVLFAVAPTTSQAGPVKGSLVVLSVSDQGTGLAGAVAGRPFTVVVEARDPLGAPLVMGKATTLRL